MQSARKKNRKLVFGDAETWKTAYLYDKGGGTWRAEFLRHDNGRIRKSTKIIHAGRVSDALEAVRIRQRELEEAWKAEQAARMGGHRGSTVADCLQRELASRVTAKPSTLSEYRTRIRYHIAPYFEGIDAADVDEDDVFTWLTALREEGYADDTIRKALSFLRSAMRRAQRLGMIEANPCEDVRYKPYRPKRKSNALDERSMRIALAVVRAELDESEDPDPFYLACLLSLQTGMRRGELCGLRWKCVDIDARRIEVAEAVSIVRDTGELYVDTPKTDSSRRPVVFADRLLARTLAKRRAAMARDCMALGMPFEETMFVLGGVDGSFMRPDYLSGRWEKLAEGLQLRGNMGQRATFHDLRHTYATVAIAAGADVKSVSESMGHADAKITLERYTSVLDSTREKTAETVAAALEGYGGQMAPPVRMSHAIRDGDGA